MSGDHGFKAGDYVRYSPGGPRRAYAGAIGVVVPPSVEGSELDWVRVNLAGRDEDYARNELEPCSFWAFASSSSKKWAGPFATWSEAVSALDKMLVETADFPPTHPLTHKRDNLRTFIANVSPNPAGAIGFHPSGGEYRIDVGGSETPLITNQPVKPMRARKR